MHLIRLSSLCAASGLAFLYSFAAEQPAAPTPAPAQVPAMDATDRFADLFKPFKTDMAAMSPDGKYIAYTMREGEMLSVIVLEIDNPSKLSARVNVINDENATPMLDAQAKEKTPAAIRWMRWVTGNRLVVETNRNFPYNLQVAKANSTEGDWFNCSGEIVAFDADGKNAGSLVTPRDTGEFLSSAGVTNRNIPRSPHIVDLCDDDPNSVFIQAEGMPRNGGRYIERYKLNVITGKLSSLSNHTVAVDRAYLFDRQGRPRIYVPTSTTDAFPHKFFYDSGSTFNPWKPLDQFAIANASFSLAPENYFGQRSIPLGFGQNKDVLYYASNTSHDTYGVYGLDLKAGKQTAFVAESPVFDLYSPVPGVFPDTNKGTVLGNDDTDSATNALVDPVSTVDTSTSVSASTASDSLQALQQQQADNEAQMAALDGAQDAGAAISARLKKQAQTPSLLGNLNDAPLVFDRFTHDIAGIRFVGNTRTCSWFNPSIRDTQTTLERIFTGRTVSIVDWDSNYQRFLVRVSGNVDSGAYYIYDRGVKPRLAEFVKRAPWLSRDKLHETSDYSFTNAAGHLITGTLTYPRPEAARTMPIPVIVLCQSQPWARIPSEFQPELHAYADMGFAVIQVNTCGVWGFGLKQREISTSGTEIAQAADIMSAVEYLAKRYAFNIRRMAIAGKSHGGYLALRALQLYPDRFRCAIAIDSILDIKSWLQDTRWTNADAGPKLISAYFGDPAKLQTSELVNHPETITKPVLLMNYRGEAGKAETTTYVMAKSLNLSLHHHDIPSELVDLSDDYMNGLPRAKAEAFQHIEDFLNTFIYEYKAKAGDLKILKEDEKSFNR